MAPRHDPAKAKQGRILKEEGILGAYPLDIQNDMLPAFKGGQVTVLNLLRYTDRRNRTEFREGAVLPHGHVSC